MGFYSKDHQHLCRQRLMKDINELVKEPYPKIRYYPYEDNITRGCLVLTPDGYAPLHLTFVFPEEYPTRPPRVAMDSDVHHPNVQHNFICASILHVDFTPAYTLKGIAIQLLSFFDSDSLEQEHWSGAADLAEYKEKNKKFAFQDFKCEKCNLGSRRSEKRELKDQSAASSPAQSPSKTGKASVKTERQRSISLRKLTSALPASDTTERGKHSQPGLYMDRLPNELLLMIIDEIKDLKDVTNFARAWPRLHVITRDYDVIRRRELQCFCLKKDYRSAKLGVGVDIHHRTRTTSSEFDLLSQETFKVLGVDKSIHQIPFAHWLPLPISRLHWQKVKDEAKESLGFMSPLLKGTDGNIEKVLFTLMNDIVVKLNQVAEESSSSNRSEAWLAARSTLRHASEKAIDSYFHLFHLLVCLATEDDAIVRRVNRMLESFMAGKRTKTDVPNLGHLLIALLISDKPVTEALLKAIITEAITRNVVWMLDKKGAGMAELSYLERNTVSKYRLSKTFEASRTSYCLLMFSELFRRTARQTYTTPLSEVRKELFDRLGGPPREAAANLAAEVRRLHTIGSFPAFLKEMGMQNVPSAESFTALLRKTVQASVDQGYSCFALAQDKALSLRYSLDKSIVLAAEEREKVKLIPNFDLKKVDFFPNRVDTRTQQGGRGNNGASRGHNRGGRGNGGGARGSQNWRER